jgi:RNA polymerase sigma factor for flagellar operon FliA
MYTQQGVLDRESVIERYGAMVRRTAAHLAARLPSSIDIEDLVQAGMIGLLDAVSRFDAMQGVQFETFASQRVRGAMIDELRGADWMPRSVRRSQRQIETAIRSAEHRLQRAPREAEIAAELKIDLPAYQELLLSAKGAQLVYLEDAGGEDGEEGLLERAVPAEGPGPLERVRDQRFRAALVTAIEDLPERERLMMSLYYEEGLNLKEIGAVLGVTESRVSQMHTQAVARLRGKLGDWL